MFGQKEIMFAYQNRSVVIAARQLRERTEIPTADGVIVWEVGDYLVVGDNGARCFYTQAIFEKVYQRYDGPYETIYDLEGNVMAVVPGRR
jgi:hypothetical protein